MKNPTISKRFPDVQRHNLVGALRPVLRSMLLFAYEEGYLIARWPRSISPMTEREIQDDARHGGGHGVYLPDTETIRLDPSMPWVGLVTNLIHELWHHVNPRTTEKRINDYVVPEVYGMVTGKHLHPRDWEKYRGHK